MKKKKTLSVFLFCLAFALCRESYSTDELEQKPEAPRSLQRDEEKDISVSSFNGSGEIFGSEESNRDTLGSRVVRFIGDGLKYTLEHPIQGAFVLLCSQAGTVMAANESDANGVLSDPLTPVCAVVIGATAIAFISKKIANHFENRAQPNGVVELAREYTPWPSPRIAEARRNFQFWENIRRRCELTNIEVGRQLRWLLPG